MPRAATTEDAFNALAERRRREILDLLARRSERAVGELVDELGLPQPTVSKHLGVLRKVGLVTVHQRGRRRVYRLNAAELKVVHDWVKSFEHFWDDQLVGIKAAAERRARSQPPEPQAARPPANTNKQP